MYALVTFYMEHGLSKRKALKLAYETVFEELAAECCN